MASNVHGEPSFNLFICSRIRVRLTELKALDIIVYGCYFCDCTLLILFLLVSDQYVLEEILLESGKFLSLFQTGIEIACCKLLGKSIITDRLSLYLYVLMDRKQI